MKHRIVASRMKDSDSSLSRRFWEKIYIRKEDFRDCWWYPGLLRNKDGLFFYED